MDPSFAKVEDKFFVFREVDLDMILFLEALSDFFGAEFSNLKIHVRPSFANAMGDDVFDFRCGLFGRGGLPVDGEGRLFFGDGDSVFVGRLREGDGDVIGTAGGIALDGEHAIVTGLDFQTGLTVVIGIDVISQILVELAALAKDKLEVETAIIDQFCVFGSGFDDDFTDGLGGAGLEVFDVTDSSAFAPFEGDGFILIDDEVADADMDIFLGRIIRNDVSRKGSTDE